MFKRIIKQVNRQSTFCFISKQTGKMHISTIFDVSNKSSESSILVHRDCKIFWI